MKEIVVLSYVQGPTNEPKKALQKRRKAVRRMSLGALIADFSQNAVVRRDRAKTMEDAAEASAMPEGTSGMRIFIVLDDIEHADLCRDIGQFRIARNRFAHHFITTYDVFTLQGCEKADRHLQAFLETIDAALLRLRRIGEIFEASRQTALVSLGNQQCS